MSRNQRTFLLVALLPLLGGCDLFEARRAPVDPLPILDPQTLWSAQVACNGAFGSYDVTLFQHTSGSYSVAITPVTLPASATASMTLTNAAHAWLPLAENRTLSAGRSVRIAGLSQAKVDAFPMLVVTAQPFPAGATASNTHCALPENPNAFLKASAPAGQMTFKLDIGFNGNAFTVPQMSVLGNKLYLSGSSVGVAKLDITDPLQPSIDFAASDDIIGFSAIGQWGYDRWASRALLATDNYLFAAGTFGMDAISFASPGLHEEAREEDLSTHIVGFGRTSDPDVFVSVSKDGGVKRLRFGSNGFETLDPFSLGLLANADSVASFRDKILVSSSSGLLSFEADIQQPLIPRTVGSVGGRVTASHDHYLMRVEAGDHKAGYYGFDASNKNVAFFEHPASATAFALSDDGHYLFANEDGQSVRVYELTWP